MLITRHNFDLFSSSFQERSDKVFTVAVSYIEIYMEELRDLLSLDTPSKDMHVREDSKGNTGNPEIEYAVLWIVFINSTASPKKLHKLPKQ